MLKREKDEEFNNKIVALDPAEQFYLARKNSTEIERKKQLDAVSSMKKKKRKRLKKVTVEEVEQRISEQEKAPKTKSITEFNIEFACSVKALGVSENKTVKPTTHFFSGKMLLFAKLLLKSFIYDLLETFVFPNEITKKIYEKYDIDFVYLYHILTDTDSTAVQFLFICKENSKQKDIVYRDVIFEVIKANDIVNRFDTSHKYWDRFSIRDEKTRKRIGLFEIEHIEDPCFITIAVKPKEYIETFQSEAINKKHKGLKKGTLGMEILDGE